MSPINPRTHVPGTQETDSGPQPGPQLRIDLQAMADDLLLFHRPAHVAGPPPGQRYTPPIANLAQRNTARLLPARYSDSVLTRLSKDADDLACLYALDNVTNDRLNAEAGSMPWLPLRELVTGGPYTRIVNAAFAHPHPQGARFSTPFRGAWYAGFELATAKAEVLFHRSIHLNEIAWNEPESLDYDHYQADFAGSFHDLRTPPEDSRWTIAHAACLAADSYVASQGLAVELMAAGSLGVVYPSTRKPGGTCIACFQPSAVAHVRKRDLHRLTWYPDRPATFCRVARADEAKRSAIAPVPDRAPDDVEES